MSKKLGKRAFINRLKKLDPTVWARNAWSFKDGNGVIRYCDLGWMGHVHGMEYGTLIEDEELYTRRVDADDIQDHLAQVYDIPWNTISVIPTLNDKSPSFEINLRAVEALLSGEITFLDIQLIRDDYATVEDVLSKNEHYHEALQRYENQDLEFENEYEYEDLDEGDEEDGW